MTYRPREELRAALIAAFSAQPEVTGIYVFGGEVEGDTDEYSDIDMVICSDDLACTFSHYRATIESIAPVAGSFLIHADDGEVAEMLMLEGFSPYQKIDLSISKDLSHTAAFGLFRSLYERLSGATGQGQTSLPDLSSVHRGLTNRLNDTLFSIPRFTKCLFRGKRDLYRRWFGTVETLAALLYESHFGPRTEPFNRLRPEEYKRLFKHLTPEESDRIERIQPRDGRPDLCLGFGEAVRWIVELYRERAAATGEHLDTAFAERLLSFLEEEIGRFRALELSASSMATA